MEKSSARTSLGVSEIDHPVGPVVVLEHRHGIRVLRGGTADELLWGLDRRSARPFRVVMEEHLGLDNGAGSEGPTAAAF